MYNIPNMGHQMINQNSMINYTYLSNSNYSNFPQTQTGYNNYMSNPPTNKFTNQFSYQQSNQNQIFNNMYPNKIPNNTTPQNIPINSTPVMNNIVSQNLHSQSTPSITQSSQTSLPLQKDANLSSTSTSSAANANKKPINLEAQSFIPKNLKKNSISSEKEDLQVNTPKMETIDTKSETKTDDSQKQTPSVIELHSDEKESLKDNISSVLNNEEQRTPLSNKLDEDKILKTPLHEGDTKQTSSNDNFSLEKNDSNITTEEKPVEKAQTTSNTDTQKDKPKSLLKSILSQPTVTTATKQSEKTVVNNITTAKKKGNEVKEAYEEKARIFREQEKQKKEERLKEEIKQKQLASTSNASSKKTDKETKRGTKQEIEVPETANEKNKSQTENDIEKVDKENKEFVKAITEEKAEKTEKKFTLEKVYFRVYENEKEEDMKNRYSFDYLFSFRNWKICSETRLIENLVTGHFKDLRETVEELSTAKQHRGGQDNKGGFGKRGTKFRDEIVQPKAPLENMTFQRSKIDLKPPEPRETPSTETGEGLGKWGRKDLSKEEKLATEFKQKREDEIKKDPIKFKLTE